MIDEKRQSAKIVLEIDDEDVTLCASGSDASEAFTNCMIAANAVLKKGDPGEREPGEQATRDLAFAGRSVRAVRNRRFRQASH